ncbi:hypothetical protein KM043_003873 [Ampulex compressa]|nr:hypothetical protein KM043_003873 [Ampulex compressa]
MLGRTSGRSGYAHRGYVRGFAERWLRTSSKGAARANLLRGKIDLAAKRVPVGQECARTTARPPPVGTLPRSFPLSACRERVASQEPARSAAARPRGSEEGSGRPATFAASNLPSFEQEAVALVFQALGSCRLEREIARAQRSSRIVRPGPLDLRASDEETEGRGPEARDGPADDNDGPESDALGEGSLARLEEKRWTRTKCAQNSGKTVALAETMLHFPEGPRRARAINASSAPVADRQVAVVSAERKRITSMGTRLPVATKASVARSTRSLAKPPPRASSIIRSASRAIRPPPRGLGLARTPPDLLPPRSERASRREFRQDVARIVNERWRDRADPASNP